MLRDITLPFWPTSYSSLKWSQDGQICLSVENRIYILTPACFNPLQVGNTLGSFTEIEKKEKEEKEQFLTPNVPSSRLQGKGKKNTNPNGTSGHEGDPAMEGLSQETSAEHEFTIPRGIHDDDLDFADNDCDYTEYLHPLDDSFLPPGQQFHYTQIRLESEMDMKAHHLDHQYWSIGETMDHNHVQKLEWSPLGVGKHKRCVLAVMTSGHNVLIYSPKTVLGGEWDMVGDVTAFLRKRKASLQNVVETYDQWVERWVLTRARDMAWSPAYRHSQKGPGQSLLAITNESCDLIFISFAEGREEGRKLKVHAQGRITKEKNTTGHLRNLSWSPWAQTGESSAAAWLSFSLGHREHTMRVLMSFKPGGGISVTTGVVQTVATAMTRSHVPSASCWFPRVLKSSIPGERGVFVCLYAVIFQTKVEIYTLDAQEADFVEVRNTQIVDVELPDMVVGASFVYGGARGSLDLYIVTVNGRFARIPYAPDRPEAIATVYNSWSIEENDDKQEMAFMMAAQRKKSQFMRKHNIQNSSCRNFGLAVSPFAGYVAVLSRMKPEGYIEFTMKNDELSQIVFSETQDLETLLSFEDDGITLPVTSNSFELSTEAFVADVSHISRYMRDSKPFYDDIEERLGNKEAFGLRTAIKLLRKNAISIRNRGTFIPIRETTNRLLYSTLTMSVEEMRELLEASKLSQKIVYFYICLAIISFYADSKIFTDAAFKLKVLEEHFGFNVEEEKEMVVKRISAIRGELKSGDVPDLVHTHAVESCSLCGSDMPFQDLGMAYCKKNHKFRRCSVTFVALQEGSSRSCSICAREFFTQKMLIEDERAHGVNADGQETSTTNPTKRVRSLARSWYEDIDLCPYCGGCFLEDFEAY